MFSSIWFTLNHTIALDTQNVTVMIDCNVFIESNSSSFTSWYEKIFISAKSDTNKIIREFELVKESNFYNGFVYDVTEEDISSVDYLYPNKNNFFICYIYID